MSIRSKILDALMASDFLCDDCLSEVTGVRPRQSINAYCRDMKTSHGIARIPTTCSRCRRMKTVNQLQTVAVVKNPSRARVPPPSDPVTTPIDVAGDDRPWFWEGNVQKRIVEYLRSNGWTVLSEANTAAREAGKDIVARDPEGRTVWITVKGFPEKSKNVQARHWFAGALLDLALYADQDKGVLLAMGLPSGFRTFESLVKRTDRVRQFLEYRVYWVRSDGSVAIDQASVAHV